MKIYRKRFIPDEINDVSSDEIIRRNENLIITKWLPIHPRSDIASGMSWTYFKDGFKISKLYNENGEFLYYYCDIIDYIYDETEDAYTFIDLLVDIKYYPDGTIKFLDFDELQVAYNKGLITEDMLMKAINTAYRLAVIIKNGELNNYCFL